MRDIKFRGKSAATGDWIYGFLVPVPDGISGWAIVGDHFTLRDVVEDGNDVLTTEEYCQVLNDTICQYTNHSDMNEAPIYEGDIIAIQEQGQEEQVGIIKYGTYNNPWSNEATHQGFFVEWIGERGGALRRDMAFWTMQRHVSVVGNVWDNPDIIQEAETSIKTD